MDKIRKFVRKLSQDEAYKFLRVIEQVRANQLSGLDVKKLQSERNEFRVRVGRIRIRFIKDGRQNKITDAGFRDDNTY